jgi:hypothetical protein
VQPAQRRGFGELGPVNPLAALHLHEFGQKLPAPAVQEILDGLALSLQPKARPALTVRANPQIADVSALAQTQPYLLPRGGGRSDVSGKVSSRRDASLAPSCPGRMLCSGVSVATGCAISEREGGATDTGLTAKVLAPGTTQPASPPPIPAILRMHAMARRAARPVGLVG